MSVGFQERVNFLFRAADGRGGDAEELAEEIHGGEFAQVEHGGEDPVGWGEFGLGACARSCQTFVTATCEEGLLSL